jgi:hypothetical protein
LLAMRLSFKGNVQVFQKFTKKRDG